MRATPRLRIRIWPDSILDSLMRTSDFDYELPPELIAREPARPRDFSRMMVLNRRTGAWIDSRFRDLPEFLEPSDVLVLNNTRVIRARTYGRLERPSARPNEMTREIEVLFAGPAGPAGPDSWEVLCRPGDRIRARGIEILQITLHVGIGTFIPVRSEDPARHVLKPERYHVSAETASRLNAARNQGRRIIAVGTTTTRTLEYITNMYGRFEEGTGEADRFILPGYEFCRIGGLLTNFHLPRSTLIMLVSAFASRSAVLAAYGHAIAERYRFYSYGDCMLIL